ncbi:MAG: hypothetical protein MZU91_04385 [Desulfosudis oleivorans]|nr:hypothetical protein [Desulfosudis oleivorans]
MVDTIMASFNLKKLCETAEIPLDGQEELSGYPLAKRLTDMKNIVCECELVTRQEVERIIKQTGNAKCRRYTAPDTSGHGTLSGRFLHFSRARYHE